MSIRVKRVIFITAFLIVAAVAVVLCVNYFTGTKIDEYEGTLVQSFITSQFI